MDQQRVPPLRIHHMHASGMSAADGSESPALWLPSNVPRKDLLRDKIRAKLR